jgi:hypothetical protein
MVRSSVILRLVTFTANRFVNLTFEGGSCTKVSLINGDFSIRASKPASSGVEMESTNYELSFRITHALKFVLHFVIFMALEGGGIERSRVYVEPTLLEGKATHNGSMLILQLLNSDTEEIAA